jgi:hypothetical protein
MDPLADFFIHWLEEERLFDIQPTKFAPTWRNMRTGEARVAKRLDRFLLSEEFLQENLRFRQWVSSRGYFKP